MSEIKPCPDTIWLQPDCMTSIDCGRVWCEHDAPVNCDCSDGPHPWIKFDRASDACASVQRERDALREMLDGVVADIRELISTRSDHFTMRNGERRSIEGDDGEKCWIVTFDPMFALETFLSRYEGEVK